MVEAGDCAQVRWAASWSTAAWLASWLRDASRYVHRLCDELLCLACSTIAGRASGPKQTAAKQTPGKLPAYQGVATVPAVQGGRRRR